MAGLWGFAACACLALAAPLGASGRAARSMEVSMALALDSVPAKGKLRLWLPVPIDSARQKVEGLRIDAPGSPRLLKDAEYGNRYYYTELGPSAARAGKVRISCKVTRCEVNARSEPDRDAKLLDRYLAPDALVPLRGAVKQEAEAAKRASGRAGLPWALYDRVVETMAYSKSAPGWGRGDALRACDVRTGNCTDFHSLFIGMARSSGIPARFVMGMPVPPKAGKVEGYHCWAEFWDAKAGAWVPVDASEAAKHPERKAYFFGGLDHDRVEISRGRDIRLEPRPAGGPLNYLYGPLAESDGKAIEGLKWEIEVKG